MKIVPYHADHFDEILDNLRDAEMTSFLPGIKEREKMVEYMRFYEHHSLIMTFMTDDDKAVAIFVGTLKWPGVADLWAIVSKEADRQIVGFQRACLRGFRMFIDTHDEPLHRVEAVVMAEHTRSLNWLSRLGFTEKSLMKSYGINKEDYYLVAKVGEL